MNKQKIVNKINGRKFNIIFHHVEKCRWCDRSIITYNYHPVFSCNNKHKKLYMKKNKIGFYNKEIQSIGGKVGVKTCRRLKLGSYFNDEIRNNIIKKSNGTLGKKFSKEGKNNIRLALIGRHPTEEHRKNMRLARLEYIKNTIGFKHPNVGLNEKQILDDLQNKIGFSIKRQFFIDGYFLDGYCQELNLAIEIYEDYHYIKKSTINRDKVRMKNIMNALNCSFLIVREKYYINKEINKLELKSKW